ncbi:juvenile hormone binding protein 1 [Rhodnius prolixus]|uniref:Putative odorant binding protein n=1 Tax=Rhodnius prolixus TaxID=13249 RepID=R4FM13_RHOPR
MWNHVVGFACLVSTLSIAINAQDIEIPPYVKHCKGSDPQLIECLIKALHHIRPYLAKGIPEIQMPAVEPFRMDDLSLALTSGPNGYKIVLRDMDIYGSSNFTVTKLKLGQNGGPFEAKIKIPKMSIDARYTSSGVLIILPASGNGTFNANLGDILATVKGSVREVNRNGKAYLHVDKLDVDLTIKDARMSVHKIFNNNRILTEATNLFLRENGQEILRIMMPQLRQKLAAVFKRVANQLLSNVPVEVFYTED